MFIKTNKKCIFIYFFSINKLINYLNSTFTENKRYDEIRYQYDKFIQEKINFKMDN